MISDLVLNSLARLDRALFVKLDRIRQRYVVYRRDRSNRVREILVVSTPNGDFSYPNSTHVARLYQMDMWANKDLIKKMDARNDAKKLVSKKKIHEISRNFALRTTRSQYY